MQEVVGEGVEMKLSRKQEHGKLELRVSRRQKHGKLELGVGLSRR